MTTAHGYPMNKAVEAAFCHYVGGMPGGFAQVWVRPGHYYHRRNFPNNGTTRLEFFNATRARGITNFDQANSLPANYAYALEGIRIKFLPGIDVNGARTTVAAAANTTSLSDTGDIATDTIVNRPTRWHEKIRELMEQGIVTFRVADRPVFEVFGLDSFPQGSGVMSSGMISQDLAVAAGTDELQAMVSQVGNGVPMLANMFTFRTPYPIMPEQQFGLTMEWLTAVDFTDADLGPLTGETAGNPAGTIHAELIGTMFSPGSA